MSAETSREGEADSGNGSDPNNSTECPTCGKDEFETEGGMKSHHYFVHDEKIGSQTYPCDNCGEGVEVEDWRVEKQDTICCGEQCSSELHSERMGGESHPDWDDVTTTCKNCGSEIQTTARKQEKGEDKFCDKACHAEYQSDSYSGEGHPRWEDDITSTCEMCGSDFDHPKWDEPRFCSMECTRDWRSEQFSGEGNPAWVGGSGRYRGDNWHEQRQKARDRDNYQCQSCGVPEEELSQQLAVHHIRPFRTFEDSSKANELSNLVSLCQKCHMKWEGIPVKPTLLD